MRILWISLCLCSGGLLLAAGQLGWQHHPAARQSADEDIGTVLDILNEFVDRNGVWNFITFTGHMDLMPSFQQRLMEKFHTPLYVVGSNLGPLNRLYLKATNVVVTFFTGLDDPTLSALNDTLLSESAFTILFLHRPATDEEELKYLSPKEMRILFGMCLRQHFGLCLLVFRREKIYEIWAYYYIANDMTIQRMNNHDNNFQNILRQKNYRILVQVMNDMPNVFWYNSTGNIRIGGIIGIMLQEFMLNMNATMDILPIEGQQNSDYKISKKSRGRIVDVVANLVDDASLSETCPVLADSRTCLLVPHRVPAPWMSYVFIIFGISLNVIFVVFILWYTAIKYLANDRRSLTGALLSALRLTLGIPMPNREFLRLRLPEKFMEVFSFLGMAMFISVTGSLLATSLTSGVFKPAVTNLATMQASDLLIMTNDPTVPLLFHQNQLPRSLAGRLRVVDSKTMFQHFVDLNYSYAYVVRTPNWRAMSLYQQHLKVPKFRLIGNELCTAARLLRLPISTQSPLRFVFGSFYERIFESGLLLKWNRMGFDNYRAVIGIKKLPLDTRIFKPLPLSFFTNAAWIYVVGVLLSILSLIIERLIRAT
ncbi:Hypothetical predicted protein [Drosophila guanche]|uniref:Ionotropic glutamate receptor C-terminal domain-containing protein n=1 Tax=Drosophila guanche TaxID=7266 RepID=A0A3B0IZR7_DROGU|nr:Hypothetical predicted protein [Drosophila guanche]